jgi:hypothetical protein
MSWEVEYVPEKRLVLLIVQGEIIDEEVQARVPETVRLLREHETGLLLVDCSAATTKASLPCLYRLPDYATELGAPWNTRIAVILPRSPFRIETFHFFALVFRNAGYDILLFDDRTAAENWLERSVPALQTR